LSDKDKETDQTGEHKKTGFRAPHPPHVSRITHHSVRLDWEEALKDGEAVTGPVTGDNRISVSLQKLSPGMTEEWHQVYKYDCY